VQAGAFVRVFDPASQRYAVHMIIRSAAAGDAPAISAIYGHAVLHGTGSFELVPPEAAEIATRMAAIRATGLPYLVAELNGAIAGYAYASRYRPRPGYRFTVENSVYVRHGMHGQGVGSALLAELIAQCTALGCRQIIAAIGDSANTASIRLHERAGFKHAGVLKSVGYKHGRWLDSVFMQLALGDGDGPVAG
jgi:L-amino acid N-acyltransferase YncA